MIASLIGALGALALLVTVSGVIGVVSYNVSQRVREVGIHMAIGATPMKIVAMFVAQGLVIFGVGIAVGIVIMFAGASRLDALLYKTSRRERWRSMQRPVLVLAAGACRPVGSQLPGKPLRARRRASQRVNNETLESSRP